MPDHIEKWLSEIELEERFGIPRKTWQHWRLNGEGPEWTKFGRHVRYSDVAVREWEQRQAQRVSR